MAVLRTSSNSRFKSLRGFVQLDYSMTLETFLMGGQVTVLIFFPLSVHPSIGTARVVIPLHQRIMLLRARTGCSSEEARRRLFVSESENIPQDHQETKYSGLELRNERNAMFTNARVVGVDSKSASVIMCAPGVGLRQFRFDGVHDENESQENVYGSTRRLLMDFMNGQNGCLLCYGQTGSGKTYTMFGPHHAAPGVSVSLDITSKAGIVPRLCAEMMAAILCLKETPNIELSLRMSFVEVYNEELIDLLHDRKSIGAWRGVSAHAVLSGNAEVLVTTTQDLEKYLQDGESNKRMAATEMNERSSRAHVVIIFRLRQKLTIEGCEPVTISSTLCLADLGGAEQIKESKVKGQNVEEAIHINLGILALKNCITALSQKDNFVPHTSSNLTLLLKPALGGDCKTVVIVNSAMEDGNAVQTLQALRFGETCAAVKANVGGPRYILADTLEALAREIKDCEELIKQRERWVDQVQERVDEFSGKTEVRLKSVPVGAETERLRLESLLSQQRAILGV